MDLKQTRELKVNDALEYLDQVKLEFSGRPHIYNEFLEIMKNFKSQQVNTAGVIDRVRNLFRGYNKLILGFNTFLPDGFKIELTTEEIAYEQENIGRSQDRTNVDSLVNGDAAPVSTPARHSEGVVDAAAPADPADAASIKVEAQPGDAQAQSKLPVQQQQQQQQAINYVTTIRQRFLNEPETYKSFLRILHTYQSEQKGIKDVLEQVSTLFADHPDLLREFTFFLPDVHQDYAKERLQRAAQESEIKRRHRMQVQAEQQAMMQQKHQQQQQLLQQQHQGFMQNLFPNSLAIPSHPSIMGGNNIPNQKKQRLMPGLGFPGMEGDPHQMGGMSPRAKPPSIMANPTMNQGMIPNRMMAGGMQQMGPMGQMSQMGQMGLQHGMQQQQQINAKKSQKRGAKESMMLPQAFIQAGLGAFPPQYQGMMGFQGQGHPAMSMMGQHQPMGMLQGMQGMHQRQEMMVGRQVSSENKMSSEGMEKPQPTKRQQLIHHQQQQEAQARQHHQHSPHNGQDGPVLSLGTGFGGMILNNHISVSAERGFFDNVKDYFISNGDKETYLKFLHYLDLFSSDGLKKKELLEVCRDTVFDEPGGAEYFEEFKKLVNSRVDYELTAPDNWFGSGGNISSHYADVSKWTQQGLDFNFHGCRRCTPSYRALPKDFPRHHYSERSEEEASILNDTWISIPAMEATKHMEKNNAERNLFDCEDQRFEIDMIIESNMAAIRALEPIAEEISAIKEIEDTSDLSGDFNDAGDNDQDMNEDRELSENPMSKGICAPKFSFSLEKRNLSTIHLNAIARIYGDHCHEVLELLRKNPAGAVPVILRRLRQKDLEWRKARQIKNIEFKETVDKNYERSFDHRAFNPRSQQDVRKQDPRTYSVKHLVADVKGTHIDSDLSLAEMKLLGITSKVVGGNPLGATLEDQLASMKLTGNINPQLSMYFPGNDFIIHRDIYMLLCHQAEYNLKDSQREKDEKERIQVLIRDWLRVFFQIPVHMLYNSQIYNGSQDSFLYGGNVNVDLSSVSGGDSPSLNIGGQVDNQYMPIWPVGSRVLTMFGSGTIEAYRATDGFYQVKLSFGVSYMKAGHIVGADQLMPEAVSEIGVTQRAGQPDLFYGKEVNTSQKFKVTEPNTVFLGTQSCYVFLRIYQTLFTRLSLARNLSMENFSKQKKNTTGYDDSVPNSDISVIENILAGTYFNDTTEEKPSNKRSPSSASSCYNLFLSQLLLLIDGTVDNSKSENSKYEDCTRNIFGNNAYLFLTMDKLINSLLKTLKDIGNDDAFKLLLGIYLYHRKSPATSGTSDSVTKTSIDVEAYYYHVAQCLQNIRYSEDVYRLQTSTSKEPFSDSILFVQCLGPLHSNNNESAAALSSLMNIAIAVGDDDGGDEDDEDDAEGDGGIDVDIDVVDEDCENSQDYDVDQKSNADMSE